MDTQPIRVRLNENGEMAIPAEVCGTLGVAAGDEILLVQNKSGFLMTTRRLRIEEAQRRLLRYVKPGVSLVDELIVERHKEAQRE